MADAGDQKVFASDKPTRQQLIKIKPRVGTKLRIINTFASHSKHQLEDFANMLLADDTTVKKLKRQNKDDEEDFIRAVLYCWLDLDDDDPGYPRTWEALAKCVSDAGLDGIFAKAIREAYYPDPPADAGGASTSKSSGGTAGSSQPSGSATQKSSPAKAKEKFNTDNVSYFLGKVKFPPEKWNRLATNLRLAGIVNTIAAEFGDDTKRLGKLVTHWCANDSSASWQKLVEAVSDCEELLKAKKLAEKVGADPPEED